MGEDVLLNNKNIASERPTRKLAHRWIGPFKIEAKFSENAYRLALPESMKIHPVFHVSLLKKYHENDPVAFSDRPPPEPPPPVDVKGQPEFEVEAILDKRQRRRKTEYLVNGWDTPITKRHGNQLSISSMPPGSWPSSEMLIQITPDILDRPELAICQRLRPLVPTHALKG